MHVDLGELLKPSSRSKQKSQETDSERSRNGDQSSVLSFQVCAVLTPVILMSKYFHHSAAHVAASDVKIIHPFVRSTRKRLNTKWVKICEMNLLNWPKSKSVGGEEDPLKFGCGHYRGPPGGVGGAAPGPGELCHPGNACLPPHGHDLRPGGLEPDPFWLI